MARTLTEVLAQIDTPGSFATRLRAPADELDLAVVGLGPLELPITEGVARRLRGVAHPSPFGLRDQTLHDPAVRNSWEIEASRVQISSPLWTPALARALTTIKAELGLPGDCTLKAELDKLLLYEEGQFFKDHQDSERSDGMIATLVVVLPSEYRGGSLSVEQRGERKTFHRLKSQSKDLSLLAFYSDCHHQISPVSSGVRVALSYRLLLEGRSTLGPGAVPAAVVDCVSKLVREHFSPPVADAVAPVGQRPRFRDIVQRAARQAPQRLVYLLDHEYTQRSLSWNQLKSGDRVRVAALRGAAERLDCECYLALAEAHETWMCEDDDYRGYGGRRYRDDDEDDEPGDDAHELVELQDSTIELQHWLDADGTHIKGIPGTVAGDELHELKPSVDLTPFKSEHEGYQGNYGNTVDRWYHRAAFVMWPRANSFALQAQLSPQRAVDQLLVLPREDRAGLEAKVKQLLPRWAGTVASVKDSRFFVKVARIATRLGDGPLAREWLSPLGTQRLQSRAVRREFVTLVDKHGSDWGRSVFTGWAKDAPWRIPEWGSGLLADICEDLHAIGGPACQDVASWLLDREVKIALQRCVAALKEGRPWLDSKAFLDESAHLSHVLAAAAAMSARGVVADTLGVLLGATPRFPALFLAQVLQACTTRSPELRAQVAGSKLHRVSVGQLETLVGAPPRAPGDWSIKYPLACACADCKVLARFLGSGRDAHDWPLAKDRRQHIHRVLDAAELPVRHTTRRTGSPQVLQLRKDRTLFSREAKHRAEAKAGCAGCHRSGRADSRLLRWER